MNHSEIATILWKDPEYRGKQIESNRIRALNNWTTPEYREKQRLANLKKQKPGNVSEAAKEKISESKKEFLMNPYNRKKTGISVSIGWSKRAGKPRKPNVDPTIEQYNQLFSESWRFD